jgi:hypothetical protein
VSQTCCCRRVSKLQQLGLLPLLYTMIQTADDPHAFTNLSRIRLRDGYLSAAAATLLGEVRFLAD